MGRTVVLAAAFLALALFPQPLAYLEALFHSFLAHSIVRVTQGVVDPQTASKRIRAAEMLDPFESSRLFASLAFGFSALSGALAGDHSGSRVALVLTLAVATVALVMRAQRTPAALWIGALTGATAVMVLI